MVSTERGSIKKRYGSTLFSKAGEFTGVELVSLFPVTVTGGRYLIASGSTKLYSINELGEVSEIGEGFTSGLKWSICQANKGTAKTAGPVYLTNGTDKAQYWTGAAKNTKVKEWEGEKEPFEGKEMYATPPYVPQGKYMIFANERVWMTGIAGDTSAVRWSELKSVGEGGEQPDPTLWPKNNVVRFDPEDGNPVTGIGTVGPYILVFKKNKAWIIHNAAPIATRKLSSNIGCSSHRSIVETPHGTYFLTAEQGIYLTNGSTVTEMSYKVRPTILNINPAKAENAAGAYYSNHYYLSFASGTSATNNRTLDYDVVLKSWWLHDLAGNQWATYEATAGEPFLFVVRPKAKDGILKAFDKTTFQDAGVNYVGNEVMGAYWLGAWEPFYYFIFRHRVKAPHIKKRVRAVFFNGEGQIIPGIYKNFQLAERQEPAVVGAEEIATHLKSPVEFGGTSGKWAEGEAVWGTGEGFWGGEAPIGSARMYSLGVGAVWSVGWGNNSKEPFTVDGYTLFAQFRKS